MSLRDDTMIVLLSQTKLPDSSNPLSDIVGAVQYGLEKALSRINMKVLDHYHLEDFQIEYYEGVNSAFNNKETYALNLEATPNDILRGCSR